MKSQECFGMEKGQIFFCRSNNLQTFQCECRGFDLSLKSAKLFYLNATADDFPTWLDKNGPLQENELIEIETGKNLDRISLNELFVLCKEKNKMFTECFQRKIKIMI